MEFSIEFYESNAGRCPIREFLDDLKASDPGDFAVIMAGLVKLRNRQNHRPPLSKPVSNGLFELRHVGKLNTRIFYFFVKGRRIVTVHGIRNKARQIPKRDMTIALERMSDWLKRQER